jgi:antirestriction protein ArdC
MPKAKKSVYEIVTEKILALLDKGTVPWRMPWKVDGAAHRRWPWASGKAYRGINQILLSMSALEQGFDCPYWLTYKQAQKLGAHVRKGERSTLVVFWRWVEKSVEASDKAKDKILGPGWQTDPHGPTLKEVKRFPILRYFLVFNAQQIEVPDEAISKLMDSKTIPAWGVDSSEKKDLPPSEAAEAIIEAMPNRPVIHHRGDRAYYRPSTDEVVIPEKGRFESTEARYSTIFHELSHSTGHKSRTGRVKDWSSFGSHKYSQEELVAEMSAAFLAAEAGIENTFEASASYIDHWRAKISKDPKLVVMAAAQAQKAADYILDRAAEAEKKEAA